MVMAFIIRDSDTRNGETTAMELDFEFANQKCEAAKSCGSGSHLNFAWDDKTSIVTCKYIEVSRVGDVGSAGANLISLKLQPSWYKFTRWELGVGLRGQPVVTRLAKRLLKFLSAVCSSVEI
ncbi:hypothetical protein Ancab_004770 [Ancistrocladus abbreviatus]